MYTKECEFCKKTFATDSNKKKYCCKECAKKMARRRQIEDDQPCWTCSKACGGCDWSKKFKPIKGWDAEPMIVKDKEGYIRSYRIKKCPEYIKGNVW